MLEIKCHVTINDVQMSLLSQQCQTLGIACQACDHMTDVYTCNDSLM